MEQEPGSGSSTSRIEEVLGGGSASISDRREDDRESETSQDLNTTAEQVDGSKGTDDSNRGTDVSGLQTTRANEDAESKEDHTAEQGRPSLTTGNADNQQTPEDWTIVNLENNDAGTVGQGEAGTRMERDDADTVVKEEACAQTEENDASPVGKREACTQMKTAADTDETTRERSLKSDHVVAKVGGTEGECAAATDEVDAKVRTQGYTPSDSKSPQEIIMHPNSAPKTSIGEETPSTEIVSGSQKESTPTSGAPNTASTAEPEFEFDMSQGDPSSVSASGDQEKRPKVPHSLRTSKSQKASTPTSEAPSTASTDEPEVEVDVSQGDPSSVSASGDQEKRPKVPHSLRTSKSQKASTPTSEAPSTASTGEPEVEVDVSQGDPSSVSASGDQEKRPKVPHSLRTSKSQKASTPTSEAPSTASTGEPEVEVDVSQGDPSSVSASGAQEKSSEVADPPSTAVLDSVPQKEAGLCVELSGTVSGSESRNEAFTSSEPAGKMSGSEAQGGSSVSLGAPCSVLASGALGVVPNPVVQEDVHPRPEALSTSEVKEVSVETNALTSCEVPKDVGSNSSDSPNTVGASEGIRKFSRTDSAVRNEVSTSADPPSRTVEGETSVVSKAPSTASASEAQKGFGISSKENISSSCEYPKDVGSNSSDSPNTVGASEGIRKFSSTDSAVQNEVSTSADPPSRIVEGEMSVVSKAPRMASASEAQKGFGISSEENISSSCEVSKDVGSKSSDSPNTVGASEGIRKFSRTNSAVRNEVSTSADPPSRIVEGEMSVVSKAPSTASASEAQKGFGISSEEIVPGAEVSREVPALESSRTVSQGGEVKPKTFLQISAQQSETTVSDVRGSPRPRIAGGETSLADFLFEEKLAKKDEELIQRDKTIARLRKIMESHSSKFEGKYQALKQNYDDLTRENERLDSENAELGKRCQELGKYKMAYARMHGQLEQMKKEIGTLQDQMSLYEQQHANELSRGGSYLDDTKAATPALLVSSLNGVKDASNNFVKVLKSSIQSGIEPEVFQYWSIGAVSRSGHTKFQYQAYICRVLFDGFDLLHAGVSKAVLPPTTYFRQYQLHDLKKTDTVDRLLRSDPDIHPSLHQFCFEKFYKLMNDIQHLLNDKSVDLRQVIQSRQHPRESKLYVSFCKLAVSVWLLQRLAFSFLHPAKPFAARGGAPFDLNRMQSVVPLDEPSADEEDQLRVGFYVLPGFDVGNSTIPCEVYVAMK